MAGPWEAYRDEKAQADGPWKTFADAKGAPKPPDPAEPAHPVWNGFVRDIKNIVGDTKNAFVHLGQDQDDLADVAFAPAQVVSHIAEGIAKQIPAGIAGLVGKTNAMHEILESPDLVAQGNTAKQLNEIISAPFKAIHAAGSAISEGMGDSKVGAGIGAATEALADFVVPAKAAKAMQTARRGASRMGISIGEAGLKNVASDPVLQEILGASNKAPLQDLVQAGKPTQLDQPVSTLGGLRDLLNKVAGNLVVDKIQMFKQLKATTDTTTKADREDMHHLREDPNYNASERAKQAYLKDWKPIADQYHETLKLLQDENYVPEGEAPNLAVRIVKRVGGTLDKLTAGMRSDSTGSGKLRTEKLGSEYGRSMWALVGEDGERAVGHLGPGDDGRVTLFRDGVAEDLGPKKVTSRDGQVSVETEGGKKFRLQQATTKEIEAATKDSKGKGLEYYKELPQNYAHRYLQLLKTKRARDIVEALKKSPLLRQFGTTDAQVAVDKNWRPSSMPQFRGWHFDPRVREMLDDFHSNLGPESNWLRAINTIFVKPMFILPQLHMRNEINWHFKERGAVGTLTSLHRIPGDALKAISDVGTMSPEYLQYARSGANMMRANVFAKKFDAQMQKMFASHLTRDPLFSRLAKATGRAPEKALDTVMNAFSNPVLWGSHDVALMMSLRNGMRKGESFQKALEHSQRLGITYQTKSRFFGQNSEGILGSAGRTIELVGRNLGLFWRYRSDELHAYMNTLHDLVVGSTDQPLVTRLRAADQLAAIGLMTFVYYPMMSRVYQSLFSNPTAQLRPAGSSRDVYMLQQVLSGDEPLQAFLGDVFSFGPGITIPVEELGNRDIFSGRRIYGDDPRKIGQVPYILERVPQVETVEKVLKGKMDIDQALAKQIGVRLRSEKQERRAESEREKRLRREDSLPKE